MTITYMTGVMLLSGCAVMAAEAVTEAPAETQEQTTAAAETSTAAKPETTAAAETVIETDTTPVETAAAETAAATETDAGARAETAAPETTAPAETTAETQEETTAPAETPVSDAGLALSTAVADLPAVPRAGVALEDLPAIFRRMKLVTGETGEKSRYIAHTGRSGKAPQNSYKAFQLAGEAGYWAIETDIRWTSDHVIICYHDESFDAHSDGTGMVEDRDFAYVQTLSVNAGNMDIFGPQPIATFEEYLDVCKSYGRQALIDVKYCASGYKSMLKEAYRLVAERDMQDRTIWQCSLPAYLEYIRSLDENARCWFLCDEKIAEREGLIERAAKEMQCEAIDVPVINKDVAYKAHQNGLMCVFYETDKVYFQRLAFKSGYDLVMENGFR